MNILYKMGQNGMQSWHTYCVKNTVYTVYGLMGGKKQTQAIVHESNMEALTQMKRDWQHKVTIGHYTETLPEEVPNLPMRAQVYADHKHKLPMRVMLQPKLDGIRCVATEGKLTSRRGKPITSCLHIKQHLGDIHPGIVLDGELYSHGMPFEDHLRLIKRNDTLPECVKRVEYHVYDIIKEGVRADQRQSELSEIMKKLPSWYFKRVPTKHRYANEIAIEHKYYVKDRYEGTIIRNPGGYYEKNKRSDNLMKLKNKVMEELQIIDIIPGKVGKEQKAGLFVCRFRDTTCTVRPALPIPQRENILKNKDEFIGQWTRIEYARLTNAGVPNHATGHGIAKSPADLQ